jgi:hypothetical protein
VLRRTPTARMLNALGLLVVAAMLARRPAVAAPQEPAPDVLAAATAALVETWPDGRTNYELTSVRRASMWTPAFPRIDGYVPPQGSVPVYAVQFSRVLVGSAIKVDVSVLLGSAQPPGVPVASVMIAPGSRIVVDGLRKFGVQPVTLSMARVTPMTPYLPTVFSASPRIEIAGVTLLTAPYPGYRITLRNLGTEDVSTFHLQSYRGVDKALSTLKRTDDGRPLMKPGESYTFDINITSGPGHDLPPETWSPQPLDIVDIEAVRWADGTLDGASPYPQLDARVEAQSGQRLQLRRIVDALRAAVAERSAGAELLAALERRVDALADGDEDQLRGAKEAMRETKAVLVSDIARFRRSPSVRSDAAVRQWLTGLLARYEAWLTRLSPP